MKLRALAASATVMILAAATFASAPPSQAATTSISVDCSVAGTQNVTVAVGDTVEVSTTGCLSFGAGGPGGTWTYGATGTETSYGANPNLLADGDKVRFAATADNGGPSAGATFYPSSDMTGATAPIVLITVSSGSTPPPPPPSGTTNSLAISDIYINLGTSITTTFFGDGDQYITNTYSWYLCSSRTDFVTTRAQIYDPEPVPGADAAITSELSDNSCSEVAGLNSSSVDFSSLYTSAGLLKNPAKPFLTLTQRQDYALPFHVLAVAQAVVLREFTDTPTLTKSATDYTAADTTWTGGLGVPDYSQMFGAYGSFWACDTEVTSAGSALLDWTTDEKWGIYPSALSGCVQLYASFYYDQESSAWYGIPLDNSTHVVGAPVYRDAPVGDGTATPIGYDMSGRHFVWVADGYPVVAWSGSQPGGDADTTVTVTPSPLSKTIAYGAADPTFAPSAVGFTTPDTWVKAPTCAVFTQDVPAVEVTESPIPVGNYDVICSGGVAPSGYVADYVDGTLAVDKAAPTVAYTGTSGVVTAGSSLFLGGTVSPSQCTGELTYTDESGQTLVSPVSTSGWVPGVYTITVTYEGDDNCLSGSDSATLVIGTAGESTTGGGWFKVDSSISGSPRINFGHTVQKSVQTDRKSGSVTTTHRGQLLWINSQGWRLKGTVYSQNVKDSNGIVTGDAPAFATFPCPAGVGASGSNPSCGIITGSGYLQRYDASTGGWVAATEFGSAGLVTFNATIYDGGQVKVCKGRSCTVTDVADSFGLRINGVSTGAGVPVSTPVLLQKSQNGQIVIRGS